MLSSYTNIAWHPLHDHNKSYRVPFNQVASRLIEANAMLLWYPFLPAENLIVGTDLLSRGMGIRSGREFSSNNNKRVPAGKRWYWGDSRAEVLDIETLNSFQVSYHDDMRNDEIEEWEGAIKVLEHKATAAEKAGFKLQARAKAGDGMNAPTISAQDVANAEKEEGLKPGTLLDTPSEADVSSKADDTEMGDTRDEQSTKSADRDMVEDSQDELDMDNEPQNVMSAFGLGKTSSTKPMAHQGDTAKSSNPPRWPSPSMSVAAPPAFTVSPPVTKPRGRPPKSQNRLSGGSSLKRQIDLEDSSPAATEDVAFKKPRTTSHLAAKVSSSSSSEQPASMKMKKKLYDDESAEEEEDEDADVGNALEAFRAPTTGTRKQFAGVVINIDE